MSCWIEVKDMGRFQHPLPTLTKDQLIALHDEVCKQPSTDVRTTLINYAVQNSITLPSGFDMNCLVLGCQIGCRVADGSETSGPGKWKRLKGAYS